MWLLYGLNKLQKLYSQLKKYIPNLRLMNFFLWSKRVEFVMKMLPFYHLI